MALIASQLITAASGSVGGITFSHNTGGMYVRGRATPTNPATARQTAVRTALGAANQSWDLDLTDTQQNDWNTYGKNTPVTNALGATVHRSGHAMYTRQYVPCVQTGFSPSFDAPIVFNTGSPVVSVTQFGIHTVTGVDHIAVTGSIATAETVDAQVILYLGRPQNKGRRFYKSPYQLAAFTPITAGDTGFSFSDLITALSSDYPFEAGMFVPFRLTVLYADGRYSQDFADLRIVATIP